MLKRKLALVPVVLIVLLWLAGIVVLAVKSNQEDQQLTEVPKLEGNVRALELQVQKEQASNDALRKQLKDQETKYDQQAKQTENDQKTIQALQAKIQAYQKEVPAFTQGLSGRSESPLSVAEAGASYTVTYYNITGTTASGRYTTPNVTIAVDPRIIPLGSICKLTFPNGQVLYRRADDTGGAIQGFRIDIYESASASYCEQLGRVSGVKVEVVGHV